MASAAYNPLTGQPLYVGQTVVKDGVTYTGSTPKPVSTTTTAPSTSSAAYNPLTGQPLYVGQTVVKDGVTYTGSTPKPAAVATTSSAAYNPLTGQPLYVGQTVVKDGVTYTGSTPKPVSTTTTAPSTSSAAYNPLTGQPLYVGQTVVKDGVTYTGTTPKQTSSQTTTTTPSSGGSSGGSSSSSSSSSNAAAQAAAIQAQLADAQAKQAALTKYGLTDTSQIVKSGSVYIPTPQAQAQLDQVASLKAQIAAAGGTPSASNSGTSSTSSSSSQAASVQAQLADAQAKQAALTKYGLNDTSQIVKSGNEYVPTAQTQAQLDQIASLKAQIIQAGGTVPGETANATVASVQAQLADAQAKQAALTKYGLTDTSQIVKSGNEYVPNSETQAQLDAVADLKNKIEIAKQAVEAKNKITDLQSQLDTTENLEVSGVVAPDFSASLANASAEGYLAGVAAEVAKNEAKVKAAYDAQLVQIAADKKAAEAKIADLTSKQEGVLDDVEQATAPFRAALEASERARLKVEENFAANQALTEELDSLLSDGNALIKQQKEATGLSVIRTDRINQTISDVNARAGVIQAVMAARNNQITVAENMIDRSVNAIAADRNDQLQYYTALYNFYEGSKGTENAKMVQLTADEKTYINAKITLLENDLSTSEKAAENIKAAMINPTTALIYAQAGITLNDTVEQINAKLANYTYKKEVADNSNALEAEGYTAILSSQASAMSTDDYITITDSRGGKTYFKRPVSSTTSKTQVVATNGKLVLIDSLTGETLKDLGIANTEISSGSSSGGTLTQAEKLNNATADMMAEMERANQIGGDGFISPAAYKVAKQKWVGAGLSSATFDSIFSFLANPNNPGGLTAYGLASKSSSSSSGDREL